MNPAAGAHRCAFMLLVADPSSLRGAQQHRSRRLAPRDLRDLSGGEDEAVVGLGLLAAEPDAPAALEVLG